MKCAVLCFILVCFWSDISCKQGDTFEYECDILHRLDDLEAKVNASDKVVADLEGVNNDLESKVNTQAQLIIGLTNKVAKLEAYVEAGTTCPYGWLQGDSSCYLFGTQGVQFTEAENYCRQHGGHLVEVNDAIENNFLKNFLKQMKPSNWWIGVTDESVEGEWRWYSTDTLIEFSGILNRHT